MTNITRKTKLKFKVEIYSTARCPYCQLARQFLDKKGIQYIEFFIDKESHLREEMIARSDRTSVPQIFIDGEHVGGFEDMAELDVDGELDSLLGLTQRASD
ncbi:MAG: glutaredoxin 3 [Gammaproteobacteria bacterium]|nr:glutaredoxin 3 [Gammaproteobacteria bacterium]